MCVNILAMIAGYNTANVDVARLPVYLNYTPSGTSVANMAHWSQARGRRRRRWRRRRRRGAGAAAGGGGWGGIRGVRRRRRRR